MKRILLLLSLCLFLFTIPSKAADVPIRETDVSTASEGNDIVLLNGTFKYLTKEEILSRINEIRLEACKEGVPDPRNSSRSLSEGDYVAIKWSSDLEWIAQTRAAEATVHMDHTRPNNKKWSGVSHDGISSFAEDLAWNSSADILYGINQWYDEKADWVNQNSSAVTGHYTSIINPQYTYIGIGAFKPSTGYGAVAGELRTGSGLNEEQTGAQGSYQQKVEIIKAKLTISSVTEKTIHIGKSETLSLNAETSYENNLGSSWSPKVSQVSLMGTTEWETNDSTIADVNNQGLVTGASAGTAIITAKYNGNDYKTNITVEDHKWVEQSTTPPTCTEPGRTTYKCSVCNQTHDEETAATGHSWDAEYTVDKEATCTKDGSESIHCKNCEATKDSKVIPALGHKAGEAVIENKVDSTCTKEGSYDEVIYCTVCKEEISREKKVIEKKDHSWDEGVVTREATKDLPGIKTFTCTVCEETYTLEIPYDHTVHTYEETVVEPTCTEGGYTLHTCSECGESYKDNETDALGHDYDEKVTKEPSCEEDGVKTYTCSVCGDTFTEPISKTGHSWDAEYTVDQEATCTKDGSESIHCKNCEATKDSKVIPALGHKAGEAVVENKVDSTCTKEGSYDEVIYCTVCKEEISREKKVIEKKDHSWDEGVVTREATKDLPGIKTFTCTVCEETYTLEIPYDHTVHTYEETVVEPTCTEGGYTLHTCSECGESYKDNETDALGHDYDEKVTKEPSCEEDGVKTYTCSVCGDTFTEPISKTGHSWDAEYTVDKEANCTEAGSKSIHCKKCEATKDTESIPALGHKAGEAVIENKVNATCTKEGSYDEVIYCTVCKEEISREKKVIEKKDHSWNEGVVTKEATEDEEGERTYTCTVCGEKKTEVIPALTHEHEYISIVIDPTCTEGGYTLYTCSCGDSYRENEKEALGHSYKEEVTKEATCEEAGEKRCTCERCWDTYTDEIPATGHKPASPVKENEIAATFDSEGSYDSVVYCSVCKKELSRETVVTPKLEMKDQTISAAKTSYVFTFNSVKAQSQALSISGAHGTLSFTSGNTKVYAKDGKLYVAKAAPAGTYTIKVTAAATEDGEYKASNTITITVKVGKAANTIKATPATKKFKAAKVKKKAQSFKIKVTQAQGRITFKSSSSKVKVTTAGKVTVKKGTKKGKYRITVTAAGNGNYKQGVKTITVVIK